MQRYHIEQSDPGHVNINVKKELSKHTKLGGQIDYANKNINEHSHFLPNYPYANSFFIHLLTN